MKFYKGYAYRIFGSFVQLNFPADTSTFVSKNPITRRLCLSLPGRSWDDSRKNNAQRAFNGKTQAYSLDRNRTKHI